MLSVIIPTHNRKEILHKSLDALLKQTVAKEQYEIIIIDDGSTDGTEGFIKPILQSALVSIRYYSQTNKGPAAARNYGIREANGDLILIIGDDIIASPTLIEEHLQSHAQNPDLHIAILGFTTWSPDIHVTPFMYWLENGGPQFSYYQIENRSDLTDDIVYYLYTSNVSMKKQLFLQFGFFDEDFPYAAFEDTEFAYRLRKKGMKLYYNKKAVAFHYHTMTIESFSKRMQRVGKSMHILFQKQRELIPIITSLTPEPSKRQTLRYHILSVFYPILTMLSSRSLLYEYYGHLIRKQLWMGYRQALKQS